jgi:hypothetical protein
VHAALVHLWHWQGRHEFAEQWAAGHGNGETAEGLAASLDTAGARYAETRSGEEAFLEWAIRTRRGAAVVVQNGSHMVNLVGLDRRQAHILDSNSPAHVQHWPRETFLRDWKQSGGWAVTPVGTPPPPEPWVVREETSPARASGHRAEGRVSARTAHVSPSPLVGDGRGGGGERLPAPHPHPDPPPSSVMRHSELGSTPFSLRSLPCPD